jgi:hypothetical protein
MDKQVKQIIKALIKKSKKGNIVWNAEGHGNIVNGFNACFSMGIVRIRMEVSHICHTTYSIAVLNGKYECVCDRIASKYMDGAYFDLMKELYRHAGESRFGAKRLFENMLKEIESDDIIGGKTD